MTIFTVTWHKGALGDLATLWMAAQDPNAVTDASNAIDALLRVDPRSRGKPVKEGLFNLEVYPLRVLFSVSEDDRLVEVEKVGLIVPPAAGWQVNGQGTPP